MEKLFVKVHNMETDAASILPYFVKLRFEKTKFKTAKLSDKKYKFKEEFNFPLNSKVNEHECLHIELCTSVMLTVKVGEVFLSLYKIRTDNIVKKPILIKDGQKKFYLKMTILVIKDPIDILFFKMKKLFPNKQETEIRNVLSRETNKKQIIKELKNEELNTQSNDLKNKPQEIGTCGYGLNAQTNVQMKNEGTNNALGRNDQLYGCQNALSMPQIIQTHNGNISPSNIYNANSMIPINAGNPNVMNTKNPMMHNYNVMPSVMTNNSPMNANLYGPMYQSNQVYTGIGVTNNRDHPFNNGTNTMIPPLNPGADNILFHSPHNKKKALLIGINYYGSTYELTGCVNDTIRMQNILISQFGFIDSSLTMIRLIDNAKDPNYRPTKNNILSACAWLTTDNQPGDVLFFLYSGHGSQQIDPKNIEEDGYNETILPCDHKQAGQIIDDDLHRYLIQPLHNGVKLVAVMDCCRAGTSLDLAYEYKWKKQKWKEIKNPFHVICDVSQFSGCRDEEVSYELNNQRNAPGGSLVTALIYVLANAHGKMSYDVLLRRVNDCIQTYHSQTVAFMSSQMFDMNRLFDFENILMNKNQNLGLTINYYRHPIKKKRKPIFFM